MGIYKRVGRELAYQGQVIKVYRDDIEFTNGKHSTWDYVEHAGGSAALAVLPNGKILMVSQFRNAFDEELLELPAGGVEPGEDRAACAVRELEEETGYHAEKAVPLVSIKSNVALFSEQINIFLCTGLTKTRQTLDEEECIKICEFTLDELVKMVFSGMVTDSKSVAGILAYREVVGKL